jgi:uncharacterized protein YjbI with pentapeptide repeats
MVKYRHLRILKYGVETWNQWRSENPEQPPDINGADLRQANLRQANLQAVDLRGTDLSGADLIEANLSGADLYRANFRQANLRQANLRWANLRLAYLIGADLSVADLYRANLRQANLRQANLIGANLSGADLRQADLSGANLKGADLFGADLSGANLRGTDLFGVNLRQANLSGADLFGADLRGANLRGATLVDANLENANLNGCRVYGISAWNLRVNQETKQSDLIITHPDEATVTVGDLEVAQFIYLLLSRKKLRNVLDTITFKAVLLLGRFTAERKAVLDALADELRKHNLLPIIFDFERSTNRDFTETIRILAGLSLFVIVDITKPKSEPQELSVTVPDYRVPFVPILKEGEDPYSVFADFGKYDWVLKPILKYRTKGVLVKNFRNAILEPAWRKHLELQRRKKEELEAISIEDYFSES